MARSRREQEPPRGPLHVILVLATLTTVYPVLWVVSIAFSGRQTLAIADVPPDPTFLDRLRSVVPWPEHWSVANFVSVMTDQPFGRWVLNSLVVAIFTTLAGIFLSCTAAYAFSRFRFPGRRAGMMSFLVSQMFPGVLTLIPIYIIMVQVLGLGSSRLGLIIVYAATSIPFSVWMLKGYFDTIPKELEEAAVIEGASPGTIFWRIVLPLAKPAVAITALFSFMTAWNEFILAATFLDDASRFTLPVALQRLVGEYRTEWGRFAAGALLVSAPVMAVFFALQRHLVGGLTAGGVKG
jgi:arabinogalactan oligomer / maltooligosaccharide transport system permease protein